MAKSLAKKWLLSLSLKEHHKNKMHFKMEESSYSSSEAEAGKT